MSPAMSLSIMASGEGDGSLESESGVTRPEALPPRADGEPGADLELPELFLKQDIGLCLRRLKA